VVEDTRLDPLPLVSDSYVGVDTVFMLHLDSVEIDAPDRGVGVNVLRLALHAGVHELLTVIRHRLPCVSRGTEEHRQEDSAPKSDEGVQHDDASL